MPIIAGHTFTLEQHQAVLAQFEADKTEALQLAGVSLENTAQHYADCGYRTDAELNAMTEAEYVAAFPEQALRRAG